MEQDKADAVAAALAAPNYAAQGAMPAQAKAEMRGRIADFLKGKNGQAGCTRRNFKRPAKSARRA